MFIQELQSKIKKLRTEAAFLEHKFHCAAVNYLNDNVVEVVSCDASNTNGKACLEEISASYNSNNDLVTIEYVIMNKYGDFVETKQIIVNASEIEKYILI